MIWIERASLLLYCCIGLEWCNTRMSGLYNTVTPLMLWPSTHSSFYGRDTVLQREILRQLKLRTEWNVLLWPLVITQVSDQITYRVSTIFLLILIPILAMIQEDYIVITTRSPSNIIDLIIVILNLCIWISSECFDCVLKKPCIGMPAIVVETAS